MHRGHYANDWQSWGSSSYLFNYKAYDAVTIPYLPSKDQSWKQGPTMQAQMKST